MVIEDNPQTAKAIIQDTTGSNNINLVSANDTITITEEEGFEGIPLQHNSSYNNSLLILLIFSLFIIFVAISRRKISLRTLISNKEESKDEVRHTIIDLTIRLTLCTISVILYAIMVLYLSSETIRPELLAKPLAKVVGAIALYIIAQEALIWIIGKIFFTPTETKQFLKDNITYYTLPSIIFTPIIILYILTSWHTNSLIYIALAIVWIIRLTFIIRNIKIFKHNIATSFNIILYLCTVEIMPIAIIYKWALNI